MFMSIVSYLDGSEIVIPVEKELEFNLNAQISRDLMIGPKEFIKPDPAKVDAAFLEMGQFIWGKNIGWDEKRQKEFVIPPTKLKLSQNLRKEYLSNIDGYDMSFLSERFEECPCEVFGRRSGFISIRDLAEKKIADMIVTELKKSKSVRYVSLASGGYYFDYRVLRRVCIAWENLNTRSASLEVFFVDPAAPYIPELETLLKQPQYKCKNLELKLHAAAVTFEDFPKNICPTVIGGIDMPFDFKPTLMEMYARCKKQIRGVFLVDIDDAIPTLKFFFPVERQNKKQIQELQKHGYVDEKIGVENYALFVKNIPFSKEGIKLFNKELKAAGLIK